jgi:hypothetical protein
MILARRGHGKFRERVSMIERACRITQSLATISVLAALFGSTAYARACDPQSPVCGADHELSVLAV